MNTPYRIAAVAVLAAILATSPAAIGQSIPLSEVSHIHGIGFDAAAPGSLLLATHYGLYRAHPDGTATAVSSDRNDYMGFTPDPANPDRLLASGHPAAGGNLGVIVSEDGGATWTQLAAGVDGPVDFHAMTISRADPETIYGLYGDIQVSRDGGATWAVAGLAPGRVIDLAASPGAADSLYAGTVGGLMLSTDAAQTWTLIGPPDVPATMVEATGDGSVYAFFHGAGLFRQSATDGEWSRLAGDFGESYILHLAADPSDPMHLVAVTEKSALLESQDGGRTWEPFGP
jgi:photosystem II stability/assembly factor-like uncharacterized protein